MLLKPQFWLPFKSTNFKIIHFLFALTKMSLDFEIWNLNWSVTNSRLQTEVKLNGDKLEWFSPEKCDFIYIFLLK